MILTIRKRTLVAVMACIILLAGILVYFCTRQTFSPALKYCIVIDAGHGGIDVIMLNRFFHCVENKLPMPIDIYDACSWMAVTALSAQSIAGGNIPVEFPDFTRGRYKTRKTVDVLDLPKVIK